MDNQPAIVDVEARQRFESFKLGKGLPSSLNGHRPVHSRSRSRNLSISSVSSLSLPPPKSSSSLSEEAAQGTPGGTVGQGLVLSTRRNSHHKRRSSVSTRHESAEMMGVSLPDLPTSSSEDNVNFGDKDSIRRRALWALEGKPDVSFSKVEIPELSSTQVDNLIPDLPTKSSFPPVSAFPLANKRDSFKLLSSASSTKDQLHTLVEEEEEEEEGASLATKNATEFHPEAPMHHNKGQSNRPRPFSLRPLSLTPERLSTVTNQASPSPTPRGGLKTLSLSLAGRFEDVDIPTSREQRRRSFNVATTHVKNDNTSFNGDNKAKRRSSISYKISSGVATNFAGLPTPEMTPNYKQQRFSLADSKDSSDDEAYYPKLRPLSTSEQHFLVKSHNALLARITDLEKALSTKVSAGVPYYQSGARPISLSSESSVTSDQTLGEPNDEMLQLLADLKAERDEYKRDVDAWRARVKDMENRLAMMAKRVEVERRDAWIARSKVGLLDVEKASLEENLRSHEATLASMENEKRALELENQTLQDEISQALADLARVNEQLGKAQQEIEAMRRAKSGRLPPTPEPSDDDEGLADSDMSFQTHDSAKEMHAPSFLFHVAEPSLNTPSTFKTHESKHSLSKTWTFPTGTQIVTEQCNVELDVDRFFGCLEGEDEDDAINVTRDDLSEYSYERSKDLFSAALRSYKDDQDASLTVSARGLGLEVVDVGSCITSATPVITEEENHTSLNADEEMLGEAGGICITLTPAQDGDDGVDSEGDNSNSYQVIPSGPPVLPPLQLDFFKHRSSDVVNSTSSDFSRYDVSVQSATDPTPQVVSTKSSSPSSIPRLKKIPKAWSSRSVAKRAPGCSQDTHSKPTNRVGNASPSRIPQLVSSPSPIRLSNTYLCPSSLFTLPSAPTHVPQTFSPITSRSTVAKPGRHN